MANKSDKTSAFTVQAWIMAALLVTAAAFLYFQSATGAGADSRGQELAALSQAVPLLAVQALGGETEAFDRLEMSLERLAQLAEDRRNLPGRSQLWSQLEQQGRALLAQRDEIQAINGAAAKVDEGMPQLLEASDVLLEQSGATAALQEFQRRAAQMQQSLGRLAASSEPQVVASSIGNDLAWLRQLTDALAGLPTDLDVAALDAAARDSSLVPVNGALMNWEPPVEQAISAAARLDEPAAKVEALAATAEGLYRAVTSAPASGTGAWLAQPLLPLALIGLALLMLGVLAIMHARTAVFERTSREQTEQNERNQQAILRLLDELGSLADGDLTVEATVTEDITGAIADSINYAIEKLRELVATINETAIMVDSAAKQTESTAVHMARAAKNQNAEIRAATESIESMAGSIEEVSGNAERSSDVARHSVDVAHKGGEAVRRTIDGMNAIRETIQDTSKRIKRLGESSQEIGNIVELINDIAEQTNILALNASIQASMAGEAGRGFAVVADEVQRLAERSTNATKQIEVLVRTIQADTNEAVVSMERSTTDVVGGALLAENAGAALDEIEQVSNQIASLVQNISGSAREQAGSAADVTRRTARLKEISDQTGRATTATAAAISKLSVLASQLRQTVAGFTLPNSIFESSAFSGKKAPAADTARKDKVTG
ncbi:MAG: methyl-accepting chemotaxis protein [Woeseia sp.]